MAKELREVLAVHEQLARELNDTVAVKYTDALRAFIDSGENSGVLYLSIAQTSEHKKGDIRGEQALGLQADILPLPDDEEFPLLVNEVTSSQKEQEDTPCMVTVYEAADRVGMHPDSLRRIIRQGHMRWETRLEPITHIGEVLYVALGDLLVYRRERVGKKGRPPKGKR